MYELLTPWIALRLLPTGYRQELIGKLLRIEYDQTQARATATAFPSSTSKPVDGRSH